VHVLLDNDERAIKDVNSVYPGKGVVGDMHTYELPDGSLADVVMILNAGYLTEEELDKVVAYGGLVLINDWHDAATYMQGSCPSYQ
jgi:butyrate kinase